jgi:hypothetical protein
MRRQAWGAITIKRSKVLMQKLVDVSITVAESLKNIFQAISEDEIRRMSKMEATVLVLKK